MEKIKQKMKPKKESIYIKSDTEMKNSLDELQMRLGEDQSTIVRRFITHAFRNIEAIYPEIKEISAYDRAE